MTRYNQEYIEILYSSEFPNLMFQAQQAHRHFHDPTKIQLCTLANIKSGNCSEDCAYCSQSAKYTTQADKFPLPSIEEIERQALSAKEGGSTRLCMGAAWREVRDGKDFAHVLDLVRIVRKLDMEACVTLGMLTENQARQLKEAGLTIYNHNLNTSPEYYGKIVTTHSFEDRLKAIENVRKAGIQLCCGGIIGLGESSGDRVSFIYALTLLDPQPESIPINALVPIPGTPLENQPLIDPFELVRTIATVRICMPKAIIRLSAGRTRLSGEAQALCFLAGANSIFTGERLLTTPNPDLDHDLKLLKRLGMTPAEKPFLLESGSTTP